MASSIQTPAFYQGQVFHKRLIDPKYQFHYRLFNLLVDIDHLDQLDACLKLFSYNRFNLFSFYDCDHLSKSDTADKDIPSLRSWVEQGLLAHGIELNGGRIALF